MFLWRACSDILPTRVNLARKKVQVDPRCTICNQQDETICHILWHCPLARNAWASVCGRLQKSSSDAVEFFLFGNSNDGQAFSGGIGSLGNDIVVPLEC